MDLKQPSIHTWRALGPPRRDTEGINRGYIILKPDLFRLALRGAKLAGLSTFQLNVWMPEAAIFAWLCRTPPRHAMR